jgi:hypothetical protein
VLTDGSDPHRRAFTDPSRTAVLQIVAYPAGSFETARGMYEELRNQLQAQGDGAPFLYRGSDAFLADMRFATSRFEARGYFLFLKEKAFDYALLTFSSMEFYERNHDELVSALDSFAPDRHARFLPGPVSHFDYPYPSGGAKPLVIPADGEELNLEVDEEQIASLIYLIEREARILSAYGDSFVAAWHRYYRMVFRDNYDRLAGMAEALKNAWGFDPGTPLPWVERLLHWIQGFEYYRTGTLSDLTPPAAAAFTLAGDCDSRALLFVILLRHAGVDAILLVSTEYGHSAAGVHFPGDGVAGARIRHRGRDYLFCELTERVDMGLVAKSMADPSGWIAFELPLP